MTARVVLVFVLAVLGLGCGTPSPSVRVKTPPFLAVGAFGTAYVYVARENVATETRVPFQIVGAACPARACDASPGGNEITVTARSPGRTELVIQIETDDGESIEKAVPITFWQPESVAITPGNDNYAQPGVGLLLGSRAWWRFAFASSALFDPLDVRGALEVGGRGDVVSVIPDSLATGFDVVTKKTGEATLTVAAAGVIGSLPLRVAAEEEVVAIELWTDYELRDALADPNVPKTLAGKSPHPLPWPLADERFVPVLRLRDGTIALGAANKVTFDPPGFVRLWAVNDQVVEIEAEREGKGTVRCAVGAASVEMKVTLKRPSWRGGSEEGP